MQQQCRFLLFIQGALVIGVTVAVGDDLIAPTLESLQQLGAMIVQGSVGDQAGGHFQLIEQFQAAPGTHPVAVLAPGVVEHVRLVESCPEFGAEPFSESEMLDIEPDVHGQPFSCGPVEITALGDGRIRKATMVGQRSEDRIHGGVPF